MTRLIGWTALAAIVLLLALVAAAAALAGAALESRPRLLNPSPPSVVDIEQARRIAGRLDPRRSPPGVLRTAVASQREVDLLLRLAADRYAPTAAVVQLQAKTARVQASLPFNQVLSCCLPTAWSGTRAISGWAASRWLNVDAVLRQTDRLPEFDRLRIGPVPVPAWLADRALRRLATRLDGGSPATLADDVLQRVSLAPGQLSVVYVWREDTTARLLALLVPAEDQARLRAYTARLAELVAITPPTEPVSLALLLRPMFELARQRSAEGDAALENRAAILTLALYVNGRGAQSLVPAAHRWPRPVLRVVTLQGRFDFPQHYLVSAALAVEGSGPLADAIGLYKEVDDARVGSGFSFNDIAADRAGARFGLLAVRAPRHLQDWLTERATRPETDFMPDVADLPEFLTDAEFRLRYGAVGAPAFNAVVDDIEARIAAMPLSRVSP